MFGCANDVIRYALSEEQLHYAAPESGNELRAMSDHGIGDREEGGI
jgi:hypothetical protein